MTNENITISLNKQFYNKEYMEFKRKFFKKVSQGYKIGEVAIMRANGISDDEIFIAMLVGVYKANLSVGMNI